MPVIEYSSGVKVRVVLSDVGEREVVGHECVLHHPDRAQDARERESREGHGEGAVSSCEGARNWSSAPKSAPAKAT